MVRVDFLVFGYRRLSFENAAQRAKCSSAFMRRGIAHTMSGQFDILIGEKEYAKNKEYIFEQNCEISKNPRGIVSSLRRILRAKMSLTALLLSLLIILLSPCLVWDVRVSGCDRISVSDVEKKLEELGVGVGSLWRNIDVGKVELALLDSDPDIGWVAINRHGSVAYVEIIETSLPPKKTETSLYSNVVATRDCVIRDVTVTSGYAAVKVGDVVRRGEVLISGIPPAGTSGAFCHADGVVLGECDDEILVEISREKIERELGEGAKSALSVKILNFSINIFKIYRNYVTEYVIIENKYALQNP